MCLFEASIKFVVEMENQLKPDVLTITPRIGKYNVHDNMIIKGVWIFKYYTVCSVLNYLSSLRFEQILWNQAQ